MRVLMVTPALPTPAEPNTMAPVARQIDSLRALGVGIDVLEIRGLPKLKYLQRLPDLYAGRANVDLIHAHYGFCGWLARCQMGKPIVVSFMGDDLLGTPDEQGQIEPLSKLIVQLDRWLARMVSAVIVKSAAMADVVLPALAHVVPNGVNLADFQPQEQEEARRKLGWPLAGRVVLFPGNPANPRKGFPLAQAAVEHAARQLGEAINLVALHHVPPKKVPVYMNACDAMLMTSLIEGSPNVVKEAMACNLPVVATPVGDVCELLGDTPGYAVCPRDPARLSEALVQLMLFDPRQIGGRPALVEKGLDLESVARRVYAIYCMVLHGIE